MEVKAKHPETGKLGWFASIQHLSEITGIERRRIGDALRDMDSVFIKSAGEHGRKLYDMVEAFGAIYDQNDESPGDRKKRLDADIAELKRDEMMGDLVRPPEIRAALVTFSALLRKAGDTLGRKYGPEAQLILIENLDDAIVPIQEAIERAGESEVED